ncbi:MAG: hypothetical protein U1E05_06245 [Patescibacteria group bacterium]|nr:hypothetical protein [Patescibacteria group bacterium]
MLASCNPLRTRRLERLAFRLPHNGELFDWPPFLARLYSAEFGGRGAIVGPHGSGKTTFLIELKQRLEADGRQVVMLFTNRDAGRRIPRSWESTLRAISEQTLVIADGYDALSPLSRWRLRRRLQPRGGLIVTSHGRCVLPTLLETHTSPRLLSTLINELLGEGPSPLRPSEQEISRLYHACRGNLREVFRQLYRGNPASPSQSAQIDVGACAIWRECVGCEE